MRDQRWGGGLDSSSGRFCPISMARARVPAAHFMRLQRVLAEVRGFETGVSASRCVRVLFGELAMLSRGWNFLSES